MDHGDVVEKLSSVLKTASRRKDANAAVALLLKIVDQDIKILLVKRVENSSDPWSGQMALPGGRYDSKDHDLRETIVREVLEEIHVNVLDRCRILGVLPIQRSTRRPEMKIRPFVSLLEYEPTIKLNEKELEGFSWISLKELVQNKGRIKLSSGESPAYIIGKSIIWGLTYRILNNFIYILNFH